MKLDRYRDDYSGCEPDSEGEFVKFDDVIELLREISAKLDDDDVIAELEDNDLNASVLVEQYIRHNL